MQKQLSWSTYATYLLCILLLIFCFIGSVILKERATIEIKMGKWMPENISILDLGFTNIKFNELGTINKQILTWKDQKYLVVFTYSVDTYGTGMFIYGPDTSGKTQLKDMLVLSNGSDEVFISKVPNIIRVVDINMDGKPEFIVDVGEYVSGYEQYTIISYDLVKQDLIWNEWIDKDKDTQEMVNKGHIYFISGETEGINMNFDIDSQKHVVRVYQGLAPSEVNTDWEWTSVFYEMNKNNQFVFKSIE